MKWYEKIFLIFFAILISPLILFILICWGISMPFIAISNRKAYKKSAYFKDYRIPFNKNIFGSNNYIFYNYATSEKLPIKYIRQESNSFEYFIFENQIFIFPNFSEIVFNNDKQDYEVIYRKNNKESCRCTLNEYLDKQIILFEQNTELPIKILISRNYFDKEYIDIDNLPKSIYVVRNYNGAFKEEDKELLSLVPYNTKTLYEMMLKNEKLGGKFELKNNDLIVWTFERVTYQISIDKVDGYFGVFKNNKLQLEITHWHPEPHEIYDDVCKVGEKGNLLIIKTLLGSATVIYMGRPEKCTFNIKKMHIGKVYCFESK
ncbi:MAG: hypothetical protein J1F31_03215 [Erysipelotrichales bacterium]|nr:hypothetical protein [Erysipelotrichales bacterium]